MKKFVKEFIKFREEFRGQPYRSYFLEPSMGHMIELFKVYLNNKDNTKDNKCSLCNPEKMCRKHKLEHKKNIMEINDALLVKDEVKENE